MTIKEVGEKALKDYRSVQYFPFGNDAAAPFILTSAPLDYLEAWINNEIQAIKRDSGGKKNKLQKAKYFTKLSRDFYISSKSTRMPSKGTLIYYSFINLVKVFLIINDYDLETQTEHHGLSLPSESKYKLRLLKGPNSNDGISIFHEFAKTIGVEVQNSDGLDIEFINDLLRNLPEVHEIGYALDLFPKTKRKFLPIEIKIRTNNSRNKLFYTIAYDKKFDKQMKVEKLEKGHLKGKIKKLILEDSGNKNYYRSVFQTSYTATSKQSWKMCYPKIIEDIKSLNIVPMLTRNGYRYYLDLEGSRLHRLSSALGFAFYIGTIARYRPSLNEEILKGKYQSIINEAIISCPDQFFYMLVSHITKNICAIPMAKID